MALSIEKKNFTHWEKNPNFGIGFLCGKVDMTSVEIWSI